MCVCLFVWCVRSLHVCSVANTILYKHLVFTCTGTDATHAEHIETIKQRQYVGVQSDGSFVPGELGMGLVEGRLIRML